MAPAVRIPVRGHPVRFCREPGDKQTMKAELQALLFDVDGTLADTEEVHRQAYNAAFKAAGLDWEWSARRYHQLLSVCGGKERIHHYLQQEGLLSDLPPDQADFIAGLHAKKTSIYVDMLTTGRVPLRPGVERLIREARDDGLRLAIVTTTTPANVSALFKHSFGEHEDDWFEVVAAGSIVPRKKPAPDIYNHVLEQLGLPAAACLAIEDSVNGLKAAREAGVCVLITITRYTQGQDFSDAAAVLDHLGEPGNPCQMLQGCLQPGPVVNVEYLRRVHAGCQGS
jgi:HAD superfamily hydrolase (TIGR01509 family)